MIYFSEIKGKDVWVNGQTRIGKLEDLTFLADQIPRITNLIIKKSDNTKIIIPSTYLLKDNDTYFSNKIKLLSNFQTVTETQKNELYIMRNLLDKQIIDLVGHKVVRVNDVALQDKEDLYIAGVDIGLLGILRWLKLANSVTKGHSFFGMHIRPLLLSWTDIQPLELTHGKVKLRTEDQKLKRVRPEDLADYLEKTNISNTRRILRILDDEHAKNTISSLSSSYKTSLFHSFKIEDAAKWISFIEPDDAVDILLSLSKKRRQMIISLLEIGKRQELENLITLSKISSIGKLISPKFLSINSDATAKDVYKIIKRDTFEFPSLYYVYVVNDQNQFVGVFSLHELILQEQDIPIYKFMTQNLIYVYLNTPKETTIKRMLKYRITSLPVVDKTNKHILGVVNLDDLADQILERLE